MLLERVILTRSRNWILESLVSIEDDPRLEEFQAAVEDYGLKVERCDDLESVPVSRTSPALVLACISRSNLVAFGPLQGIHDNGGSIIVYADVSGEQADAALRWCDKERGWAADFLVRHECTSNRTLALHAVSLLRGEPVYPRIVLKIKPASTRVFIATPLRKNLYSVVSNVIQPALRKVGLRGETCNSVVTGGPFPDKLVEQIRDSALLIAVIPKGAKQTAIQNVYYEAGIAKAFGVGALFVIESPRTADDLASDCKTLGCIVYENPTDLALRLYFGLTP